MAEFKTMKAKDLHQVSAQQRVLQVLSKILVYGFLGVMALIVIFPFYFMIISSLKDMNEYRKAVPTLIPEFFDVMNYVEVFTKITIPLLSPMLAYVIITGFIGGFKEYSSIVGIFGEGMGPADDAGRLNTIVGFIYDALPNQQHGRASAAALILFAIIFIVTRINMYVSKKSVHY